MDGDNQPGMDTPGESDPMAEAPSAPADELEEEFPQEPERFYATIPRRIQAVLIDGVFLLALLVLVTSLSARLSPGGARWANRALLAALLLYEPLLVSLRGGTLGHRLLNLRVVGDDGGRISFLRAFLRSLTKALLGWISFLFMSFTRRHQALHDLAARATVQLRDPSRANQFDFVAERPAPETTRRVHLVRRLLVSIGYIMLMLLLLDTVTFMAMSPECRAYRECGPGDSAVSHVSNLATLVLLAALLILGWQGKLPGARSRPGAAEEPTPAS